MLAAVVDTLSSSSSLRRSLAALTGPRPVVLPSLLLCDFGHLADEVSRLEAAGVRALHLDVMDGQFVPNLTYGMPIVAAIRRLTRLPLDVHLMIEEPQRYIAAFRQAGADVITVHAEAVADLPGAVEQIHLSGAAAGVAINPQTPLSALEPTLETCDLVLVMSVAAGFGGQAFQPVALDKLRALRERVAPGVVLEVDGGINDQTIGECARAGADWFVAGSAIFSSADYQQSIRGLQEAANA